MKKYIAIMLALAISFSFAGVGINAVKPEEKTVAIASEIKTGCELNVFVDEVVTSAINTALANGEAIAAGQDGTVDTGNDFLNGTVATLGTLCGGAKDLKIYLSEDDSGEYGEFYASYTKIDGTKVKTGLGVFYNMETGEVYGETYDKGMLNCGFNYDSKNKVFYAMNDCWQRQFGFMPAFDVAASCIGYDYVTRRIYFNYGDKEWMIQIWKGNYHWNILVGGEMGIYNRPVGTINGRHYNCATDDEMIPMTMKIYDDDRVYVDRSSDLTWWMTGFNLADQKTSLQQVKMESTFTFPNEEMCSAFTAAANGCRGVSCEADGNVASLMW